LIDNVTFKSLLWGCLRNFIGMGSSKWWLLRTVDWHSRDHHCAGCFWSTFPHGQGSNWTKPASQNGFNQGEVTSMNSFMLSAYDNPRPSIHLVSLSSHLAAETKLMQLNLNRYTGVSTGVYDAVARISERNTAYWELIAKLWTPTFSRWSKKRMQVFCKQIARHHLLYCSSCTILYLESSLDSSSIIPSRNSFLLRKRL